MYVLRVYSFFLLCVCAMDTMGDLNLILFCQRSTEIRCHSASPTHMNFLLFPSATRLQEGTLFSAWRVVSVILISGFSCIRFVRALYTLAFVMSPQVKYHRIVQRTHTHTPTLHHRLMCVCVCVVCCVMLCARARTREQNQRTTCARATAS